MIKFFGYNTFEIYQNFTVYTKNIFATNRFDADCKKHSKPSDDLEEDSFIDNDKTRIAAFVSNGKVAPPTTFLYMVNVYFRYYL